MAYTVKGLKETATTIFDDLKKAFHCPDEINSVEDLSKDHVLTQLPITGDGITFNMGGVNTTFKKLSTGEVWGSTVDRDDPDVSFNVANVNDAISGIFMSEQEEKDTLAGPEGNSHVKGYSLDLKTVGGSLWFPAENGNGWIVLPSIKMYGGLNGTDDSNTAYFACQVTPQRNNSNVSIYIIENGKLNTEQVLYTVYVTYQNALELTLSVKNADDVVAQAAAAGLTVSKPSSVKDGLVVNATAKA